MFCEFHEYFDVLINMFENFYAQWRTGTFDFGCACRDRFKHQTINEPQHELHEFIKVYLAIAMDLGWASVLSSARVTVLCL